MSAWYVLTTAPRQEREIRERLLEERDDLMVSDAYYPVESYHVWLKLKRHPIKRFRTLTPRYVFVKCSDPQWVVNAMAEHGVHDVLRLGEAPARVSEAAIQAVKVQEAEIQLGTARRTDRTKREIRKGSSIKAGDRLSIPHLGLNVPNRTVDKVEGNYAESIAPNGIRIMVPLSAATV